MFSGAVGRTHDTHGCKLDEFCNEGAVVLREQVTVLEDQSVVHWCKSELRFLHSSREEAKVSESECHGRCASESTPACALHSTTYIVAQRCDQYHLSSRLQRVCVDILTFHP